MACSISRFRPFACGAAGGALRAVFLGLLAALVVAPPAAGQSPAMRASRGAANPWNQHVSIAWSQRPLREGLAGLGETVGVGVFLDRRIDPGQLLELTIRDQPLEAALAEIAAAVQARVARLDQVAYVGPPATASKLATLAALRREEASRLPAAAKARLLRRSAWQWPALAEPRQLLAELAAEARLTLSGAEQIPHDLWPAAALPPLAWVDRLTLVLAGFDLTFEVADDGASVRLVPIPAKVALTRSYAIRRSVEQTVARLRELVPDASIEPGPQGVVVAGSAEAHEIIARTLAGGEPAPRPAPAAAESRKRYSLKVEKNASAGSVLRKVADELGKELRYDEAALPQLKQPVQLNLRDATLDELLRATVEPLGLKYRVTAEAIEVGER
jgi:hypothetical protein